MIFRVLGIKTGNTLQRQLSQIAREYAAINLMNILGMTSALIPATLRLLRKATKYHQHHYASQAARRLSQRYALLREFDKAKKYFELSIHHNEILRLEMEFDWKFELIRSSYGTEKFQNSTDTMKAVANEIYPHKANSHRLQYIYFELQFFVAYLIGTHKEQESICHEALEHFRTCLLYTSPSPRDKRQSRMPSSA